MDEVKAITSGVEVKVVQMHTYIQLAEVEVYGRPTLGKAKLLWIDTQISLFMSPNLVNLCMLYFRSDLVYFDFSLKL